MSAEAKVYGPQVPEQLYPTLNGLVSPEDQAQEAEWVERFGIERIGDLCNDFLRNGIEGVDLTEQINDRQYVLAYIPAESPYADIARSVEAPTFAKFFKRSLTQHDREYGGKYDPTSVFATVIDVSTPLPTPAGVLRICDYDPEVGFKDVNDLLVDDPENPWIDEIKTNYFEEGETYAEAEAWKRLGKRAAGHELSLADGYDIATHASGPNYRGAHGDLNGVSMLFFHACLRYAQVNDKENLFAIFDIPPFKNLQQFGEPFDIYDDLKPHPYGGPYDTIPAFCELDEVVGRFAQFDQGVADLFEKGTGLDANALLPNEYLPELYSNEAVARHQ